MSNIQFPDSRDPKRKSINFSLDSLVIYLGTNLSKISKSDSSVEVVDSGTGYVKIVLDGTEYFRFSSTGILNSNDKGLLLLSNSGTPVNVIKVYNSNTGVPLKIEATGTDTNIDINLLSKGTGVLTVTGTTNYENNVTDDDDIPNRKFVVDSLHDKVTLGTANGLSLPASPSQVLSLGLASSTTTGALSSTNWNTFNNKGNGTVTSIATTSPITGGTITSTGTIGINTASTSVTGALTSTDWNTFNGKQAAYTILSTLGTLSNASGVLTNNGSGTLSWAAAGGMVYPGAGIGVSTGSAWSTSITNTTVGTNLLTLTNPSAVTFIRINADNTVTARSAANFKTDLSLNNVTNNAQWYSGNHPTTIAGYGITDAVDISGTPVANQVAIWTDANTIKGTSVLTHDGTTLVANTNITASGEITSYKSSDIRLKRNIRQFNALDVIGQLEPVKYNWNTLAKKLNDRKDERDQYGLIAQHTKGILPEIVGSIYTDYLGIDYEQLIPILIKGIKELQKEIQELKNNK